jgi:2-polyprenyl-6-methoxyphenol hydroxylase-like FAD-dependent oxidoreductase
MATFHIIILGAGPAGLAAALAISRLAAQKSSSVPSLRVTVLEVRPAIATLGGSVNLTPLAMRYLDRLGVGSALRQRGIPVRAIELVSLRTGHRVGRLWPNVDALRAKRHDLVSAMLETARNEAHSERIEIRYGVRTLSIREEGSPSEKGGRIILKLEDGEEISGDLLIGCDGLHSSVRKLYVEPEREEVYSGRAVAYGFVPVTPPGSTGLCRTDGQPAVEDTTVISSRYGSLLVTFCNPQRDNAHVSAVMEVKDEKDGSRDGWKARGEDKQKVQADILASFADGGLKNLSSFLGKVDDWTMYPVYILPRQGKWSRGRALLIGDAAHAVRSHFLSCAGLKHSID